MVLLPTVWRGSGDRWLKSGLQLGIRHKVMEERSKVIWASRSRYFHGYPDVHVYWVTSFTVAPLLQCSQPLSFLPRPFLPMSKSISLTNPSNKLSSSSIFLQVQQGITISHICTTFETADPYPQCLCVQENSGVKVETDKSRDVITCTTTSPEISAWTEISQAFPRFGWNFPKNGPGFWRNFSARTGQTI